MLRVTKMPDDKKERKKSWKKEKQEIAPCTVIYTYVFAFLIGKHFSLKTIHR